MAKKLLAAMVAFLFLAGIAAAANPSVSVLNRDGNYYYPNAGSTITIRFTATDADAPTDANVIIGYRTVGSTTLISITSNAAGDANSNNFCSAPITATSQVCSYVWTPPSGLDNNYLFDVNVYDVTTGDDANALSGSVYIDFNACDTGYSISGDTVTLATVCTGYGQDANGGTEQIFYNRNRQGGCAENYSQYTVPFELSFGSITVCYYSTDGLGNTEATLGFTHEADSDAYGVALLVEMVLVGLLIFAVLAAFLVYNKDLTADTMIPLVIAAVIIVIVVVLYAVIL